jgi:hypothetical protein
MPLSQRVAGGLVTGDGQQDDKEPELVLASTSARTKVVTRSCPGFLPFSAAICIPYMISSTEELMASFSANSGSFGHYPIAAVVESALAERLFVPPDRCRSTHLSQFFHRRRAA